MTVTDTRAALDAAIDAHSEASHRRGQLVADKHRVTGQVPRDLHEAGLAAMGEEGDARTALDRAIAAHVEAEVARRLAAAPDVDLAIVRTVTAAYDHGIAAARCGHPEFGMARLGARAADAKREELDLRAAIAEAMAGMVPRLSRDAADELVDEFARRFSARSRSANRGTAVWEREATARTALLRALGVEA